MKVFIAISALLAVAYCKPSAPVLLAAAPAIAVSSPVQTQYHSQDVLGQYSYGYSNQLSAKNEAKSIDGSTVGAYSYVDPDGKLQTVQYSSDALNGFRVLSASNLPVAPAVPTLPIVTLPQPVEDTPEVAEARAKHLADFEAIKKSSEALLAVESAAPAIEVKSAAEKEAAPETKPESVEATPQVKSSEHIITTSTNVINPAIYAPFITAPSVALRASVPTTHIVTAPTAYGYSYGINTIHGTHAFIAPQPILSYSSNLFTSPFIHFQAAAPTATEATPEAGNSEVVVEAKKAEEPKEAEKAASNE